MPDGTNVEIPAPQQPVVEKNAESVQPAEEKEIPSLPQTENTTEEQQRIIEGLRNEGFINGQEMPPAEMSPVEPVKPQQKQSTIARFFTWLKSIFIRRPKTA